MFFCDFEYVSHKKNRRKNAEKKKKIAVIAVPLTARAAPRVAKREAEERARSPESRLLTARAGLAR